MGQLRDAEGRLIPLATHHLIGRSRAMHTVAASSEVSAQHLALTWTDDGWAVRDLASRNGTRLDGRAIPPGVIVHLAAGAVLDLGGPSERYTLVDDGPPTPFAVSDAGVTSGQAELLALPSIDDPIALVLLDPDEGWVLSMGERRTSIADGALLAVSGTGWRIHLPEVPVRTAEAAGRGEPAGDLALTFRVSRDEEYVEMRVATGGGSHTLPPRAHHYVLLTLARARLGDTAPSEDDRGWVHTDLLLRQLRMNSNQLHVSLHRARKEFAALGLGEGRPLLERRPIAHQVRIAATELRVEAI